MDCPHHMHLYVVDVAQPRSAQGREAASGCVCCMPIGVGSTPAGPVAASQGGGLRYCQRRDCSSLVFVMLLGFMLGFMLGFRLLPTSQSACRIMA